MFETNTIKKETVKDKLVMQQGLQILNEYQKNQKRE